MNFWNQKIALFLVEHALTKCFILQNNFHFTLTNEQRAVLNCASLGHNLLVSGQARTGKSTLVNSIVKELTSCGKKVKVVCSSGISCSLYGDSINSQTVHSCYGLQTADMPSHMVGARSLRLPHCMEKIHATDVLIWDEAAMSSRRIFELVNAIHHALSDEPHRRKPFGGKQVILVGEFLQLRPVPSIFVMWTWFITTSLYLNFHFVNNKTSPEVGFTQVLFFGFFVAPIHNAPIPARLLFSLIFVVPITRKGKTLHEEKTAARKRTKYTLWYNAALSMLEEI